MAGEPEYDRQDLHQSGSSSEAVQPGGPSEQCGQPTPENLQIIERAVNVWRSKLLDHSGRNRLIYYRELAKGTLNLKHANPNQIQALLDGKKVTLSKLYNNQGLVESEEDNIDYFQEAYQRLRTINRTRLVNSEEKGINTTYLASHLATWEPDSDTRATPNAPIFLIPIKITLSTKSLRDFQLIIDGEWEVNETLLTFWENKYDIAFDPNKVDQILEYKTTDLYNAAREFIQLAKSKEKLPPLELKTELLIGNFSYTKLPMVKDIQGAIDYLAANDIIAAVAGDPQAEAQVRDINSFDAGEISHPDTIPPEDEFLILDADASQSYAINAVVAGKSLVVQGPPGTGKSQTISNLIASLNARGKSVLFVAEKRAAIEAVLKRLETVGLSDLVFDLHAGVIKKRDLAETIKVSLDSISETRPPKVELKQEELQQCRNQLIQYVDTLHREVDPWQQSSFKVNGALLELKHLPYVELDFNIVKTLNDSNILTISTRIEDWINTRKAIDQNSPWVEVEFDAQNKVKQLYDLVRKLQTKLLPPLDQALLAVEKQLSVDLYSFSLNQIRTLLEHSKIASRVKQFYKSTFWTLDLDNAAEQLAQKSLFSGGGRYYRKVKIALKAAQIRRLSLSRRRQLVAEAAIARTQWTELGLNGPPQDFDKQKELVEILSSVLSNIDKITANSTLDFYDITISEFVELVTKLVETHPTADLVYQQSVQRSKLAGEGITPLLDMIENSPQYEDSAIDIFRHSIFRERKREMYQSYPELATFNYYTQKKRIDKFIKLDHWHLNSATDRVMRKVAERKFQACQECPDQKSILAREAEKRSRHKSLRTLLSESEDVLIALRPCWMMSPLMVAQLLPMKPLFDYVIFDEASQIRPEEAISAIARGNHLVVAGDRHQLPPSAFFDVNSEVDEYDEDEGRPDEALTDGYESILDVASVLLPTRSLAWHYRSRDERLIALSNDHIYEGSLTTFPSTQQKSPISFYKVDHTPKNKGEIRSNPTEVRQVVDLMLEHAIQHPQETLGVIAFGQPHATAIENELYARLLKEQSSRLDDFFDEEKEERAFVKNIERVQGDERDVIIISVGYGKDTDGHVPHRFGPVNKEGGERRINVAASRARSRMIIVASICSDDLNTSTLGKGPQLLEKLLRFAEMRGSNTGRSGSKTNLNPFELAVKYELEKLGLEPIPQYGVSGYRIDFVLPHPDDDGRMVLAVEADGASYHSSESARDRDRLRQQILENKGWHFHRIWSTAFFKDPRGEAERVKEAYDLALRNESGIHSKPSPKPPINETPANSDDPEHYKFAKPNLPKNIDIGQHDIKKLVALVRWITQNGDILLTDDEIKDRMKKELGYQRRGSKINAAFERAIKSANSYS